MSFRKIRPSFGDSSGSPSQSTSESTGSGSRPPRSDKPLTESTKRRRVPELVTRNACLNCKKARAKCDGKKPCKRCAIRLETSECIYEIHIKHAKEELVKQIKELRVKHQLAEQIIQALSHNEKVPEILERLRNGETNESIVEWLGMPIADDIEVLSPQESSAFEASDHEMGEDGSATLNWTAVTSNAAVLDHLFQLYFAWVHPVHTLFSESHFVESYQRQSEDYCSSALINAICALACHMHPAKEGDEVDFKQLSREFSDAALMSLDATSRDITSIQTFAVIFLIDCARGKGIRGSTYLTVAADNLSNIAHQDNEGFVEVWKQTVRGIRNLKIEWSQVTFQPSPLVNLAPYEANEENDEKTDAAKWYLYHNPNDRSAAWAGLRATTNREKLKLATIIHDVSMMVGTENGQKISPKHISQQYRRLLVWRDELPSVLGDIENNKNPTLPHVLSLLILYSSTMVQLLRPLLGLDGFPSARVEEIVWSHAQRGLFLLDDHYRHQYTFHYQPVLQMFNILHLTDVITRFFPGGIEGRDKDGPDAVLFGVEALAQSQHSFPVAGPLLEMLRRTATECSIRFPASLVGIGIMAGSKPMDESYNMDDFIDACTRLTYTQPIDEIRRRYIPSFSADWIMESDPLGVLGTDCGVIGLRGPSPEERGAQRLMEISNLLNAT